jgi:hypothetical protein
MFGENASLDINGSFHASTANYLQLKNGHNFYVNKSKVTNHLQFSKI